MSDPARPKDTVRKVVVDTNVILFDALAIKKFREADIHIPISVIEEVDRFKRDLGENGRNARQFSRFIDQLRAQGPSFARREAREFVERRVREHRF